MAEGDLRLIEASKSFARGDLNDRKKLFAQHLAAYVPLAGHITRISTNEKRIERPSTRLRDELEDHMSKTPTILRAVIVFGAHAAVRL